MQLSSLLLVLNVAAAWVLQKGSVAVSGADTEKVPFSQIDGPVELFDEQSLDVTFTIPEEYHPRYVAMRIVATETKEDKIYLAKSRHSGSKISVPYKVIPSSMYDTPLKVYILASGNETPPLEQALFNLNVYSNSDSKKTAPEPKHSALQTGGLPEIYYTYPQPPSHASVTIASAIIGLIDASFAILLIKWATFAKKCKQLFPSETSQFTTLVTVFAIEAVFLLYFLFMSIFSVITALSVLLPVFFIAANKIVTESK